MSVITFAGQNWLITPAALAVNEGQPTSITDQVWSLLLTGVAMVNLKGNVPNDWFRETITIFPDCLTPLQFAVQRWGIPVPTNPNFGFTPVFSLLEWAPFAGLSSVFENNASNVGFAVDVWRPTPFSTDQRDAANNLIPQVFTGINVDVGVMNDDAGLARVSYNISLLGKIVFGQNIP